MTNSLIAPSGFLIKEVQRGKSMTNIDTLFEGSKGTLESIWRASAVQDKEGNFHVVLNDNHVQEVNGTFRVRLAPSFRRRSGGPRTVLQPRVVQGERYQDLVWSAARARRTRFQLEPPRRRCDGGYRPRVPGCRAGRWDLGDRRVFRANTVQEIPLSEALQVVGA